MPEPVTIDPAAAPAAPVAEKPAGETTPPSKSVDQIVEEATAAKKAETVPLASFLELKKDNKALAKSIDDLKAAIADGATKTEISAELAAIGDEYGVDKEFLSKLSKILTPAQAAKPAAHEEKPEPAEPAAPISKSDREALIDQAFKTHYEAALATMPEYADIANAEAIKQLSLLPANAAKTFAQIIEETYGKATPGKRPFNDTIPGGGKEPVPLDIDRARKDSKYFEEIMADPKLKKEYNDAMIARRM